MKTPYRYSVSFDGKWFAKDGNDIILQSSEYYFYGYLANWREIGIEDIRNWRMSGFYRNRANNHQFVKALAKVVRSVYYTYGVQGTKNINTVPAKFHVDRLNTATQEYEEDYVSEFDFSTFQDERDQAVCQLMQGGVQELIKNNEDVEYEIPVSGNAVRTITIEPFLVKGRMDFVSLAPVEESGSTPNRSTNEITLLNYSFFDEKIDFKLASTPNFKPTDVFGVIAAFPTTFGTTSNLEFGQPAQERTAGGIDNFETVGIIKAVRGSSEYVDYLIKTHTALYNVLMQGSINIYLQNNNGSDSSFQMRMYKTDINTGATSVIYTGETKTIAAMTDDTFSYNINASFDIEADKVIYLTLRRTAGSDCQWMQQEGQGLSVSFDYYTSQFTVKGLTWYEVGKQLVSKATNNTATFESLLLTQAITYKNGIDLRPESLLMLSGDSIRGVAVPKIKISLKDYLKATDVMMCAGLGIEDNKVKIEKRSYFFQRLKSSGEQNLLSHLSNLKDWTIEDAEDIRFNELHIGYREGDNEVGGLNGRDEFNTTLKFTSSYTKNKNIMDLVSPVSASGYQIYLTYINYATNENENKDSQNDNTLFALQYKYNPATPAVGTALYPSDISSTYQVSGVTDTNRVLNIGLSPKRCLMRHAYWLLSHFYTSLNSTFGGGAATEYTLTYQTTDRNPDLFSRLSTTLAISETTDVILDAMVTDLGQSRIFYPVYVKPETASPRNYKALWAANRYGVFTTDIEGVTVEGFPLSIKERNEVPKVNEVKLLLTANNTLTDLIR